MTTHLPTAEDRDIYRQGEEAVMAAIEQPVTPVRQLEVQIQALEDRLTKNSRNSSPLPATG